MDEERGPAQYARDVAGQVARDGVGLPGRASRDPGARRLRVLGRIRDRAVLSQRTRADDLRGDDPDPQADAGGARARLPAPERAGRRRLTALLLGTGAVAGPCLRTSGPSRSGNGGRSALPAPRTWRCASSGTRT